jgi:DNA-binding NarL/FixJ family response regulator
MTQVVIAARSASTRSALRARIQSEGIHILKEDVRASIDRSSDRLRPDVLVIGEPDEVPERLEPGVAVIVVADDPKLPERLRRTGAEAWAVIPPDAPADLLRAAITAVSHGMIMLPARLGPARARDDDDEVEASYDEELTSREREVLDGIASGLTNREIAARLGISDHTVKFHISTIYGKLGASTRTEAVRLAVHRGLVTL